MPVKEPARISTQHVPERRRSALIRDAAAQLFNLDVDFAPGAKGLKADIACIRHAGCGVINVHTSASTVTRTQARVRSAGSGERAGRRYLPSPESPVTTKAFSPGLT